MYDALENFARRVHRGATIHCAADVYAAAWAQLPEPRGKYDAADNPVVFLRVQGNVECVINDRLERGQMFAVSQRASRTVPS